MSDSNLTNVEKEFLAFDWAGSQEWQQYLLNLYPTPPLSKIPKFKRNWYRRNIDSTLSESSTVGDPITASASTPPTQPTTPGFTPRYQEKTPRSTSQLLREFPHRLELFSRIGYLASLVVLALSVFRPKMSGLLVQNLRTCSRSLFYTFLVLGTLRERGFPKLNMQWLSSLVYEDNVHYILYASAFTKLPQSLGRVMPQLITCVIGINKLFKNHPSIFPRIVARSPLVKSAFAKFDANLYQICQIRGNLECSMIIYLVLGVFSTPSGIFALFIYSNFIRFKYEQWLMSKDPYIKSTLNYVHAKIGVLLSNPNVPSILSDVYYKV
ncbi:hypothetical protein BEWA_025230 [Theileria equi strain WA]|uniref:Transmembrane protein 33 n=1 Tax=Theileria equi strain WA TaxID=1537102 RepID=L0AXN9_THEEQ|nr:hypothetical protein BEWA_025230 [Theileria equi strain WA]AFZ79674.1 hypothetical protein BEWA_025230 [Theileria equi strain WA]|eukprot:XP_004829340.1 hypothetical protein BEWA_025230 [Theileria equi strain WA]